MVKLVIVDLQKLEARPGTFTGPARFLASPAVRVSSRAEQAGNNGMTAVTVHTGWPSKVPLGSIHRQNPWEMGLA